MSLSGNPLNIAVNKRQFLTGVGATAGALVLGSLRAAAAENPYDVVIMGAGSAGIPAAIFAAARGASVLVVEQSGQIGGGIKHSGGQLAAGGTKLQKRKGIDDSPDAFYADIMRLSYGRADPIVTRLFVDNAAGLVDWLEDNGHKVQPDHPIVGSEHEAFSAPRYIWAHGTGEQYRGKYIVDVLMPPLEKWIAAGKVTVLLRTGVVDLIQGPDKAVKGVVVESEGGVRTSYHAKNVLLASGGSGANPGLFEKLHGKPLHNRNVSVSSQGNYAYHQGKGIELGMAAGGVVRGKEDYSCNPGGVYADRNYPAPQTMSLRAPPTRPAWEIQVNAKGERFFREDDTGIDTRKRALTDQPGMKAWVIYDQEIADHAPPMTAHKPEEFAEYFQGHPMFFKAATLDQLAVDAGLPIAALKKTIDDYNQSVASKSDALGRQFMPLPIVKAPFYAIETAGSTITTYAGLKIDGQLRVVTAEGRPIPNLYAAGEIIGMSATSGSGTVGGCALTPALTFGKLLGEKLFKI